MPAGRSLPARRCRRSAAFSSTRRRRACPPGDRYGDGRSRSRSTTCTVEREGTVLLPGRLLADVARSLPAGDVTLELRSEQRDVELTAGDARFHFRTLPAEDFPRLPDVEGDVATLPAAPLAETIDRVARAASRDEVRPILTGVLVQAEGDSADDGRDRLLPPLGQAHEARDLARPADRRERAGPRASRARAAHRELAPPKRSRSRSRETRSSSTWRTSRSPRG